MRKMYLGALLALVIVSGVAWFVHRNTITVIHNSYAVWWVADMVIVHMQANSGAWPNDWDDLIDDYETCARESGRPWTFDELRSRVIVDWKADPEHLATLANNGSPFRAIWPADGTESHYEHHEPNEMLAEYFRKPGSN